MRICYWGTYTVAEGYPINRVLVKGLRQAGAEVAECREELWGGFLHQAFARARPGPLVGLAWRALGVYLRLIWRYWRTGEHSLVIVGYAGYVDIVVARLLNLWRRRPLVLVSFISLYDTIVLDRQQVVAASWKARLAKAVDRLAFRAADLVLVDTGEQRAHFAELFALPVAKFHRSFVGEDDEQFLPAPLEPEPELPEVAEVLFFGTYVPLHGVEVILTAARQLRGEPGVRFSLIGNGLLYPEMRQWARDRELENVCFVGEWLPTAALLDRIKRAHVCLGIFGTTPKAARVIPYKVFDALALRKPVITRDSPAIRELLDHGDTALLCPAGDGAALARAILRLQRDPGLCDQLAERGHARFRERACPRAVGQELLQALEARFVG